MKNLRVGVFFSGIDGGGSKLKDNYQVVFLSEKEESIQNLLKLNYKDCPIAGDLNSLKVKDLPEMDIAIMSPPCQPYSSQGKQKGRGESKGRVADTCIKLLAKKKVNFILLENVDNLLRLNDGYDFMCLVKVFYKYGYKIDFNFINSSHYGSKQARVRTFLVAIREGSPLKKRSDIPAYNIALNKTVAKLKSSMNKKYLIKDGHENFLQMPKKFKVPSGDFLKFKASRDKQSIILSPSVYQITKLKIPKELKKVLITSPKKKREKFFLDLIQKNVSEQKDMKILAIIPHSRSTRAHHIDGRIRFDGTLNTFTTGVGCQGQSTGNYVVYEDLSIRLLTPLEVEKYMRWPKNWVHHDKTSEHLRYKLLGNGIDGELIPMILSMFERV
jgi:DNA (cytosine-5)-methyltransferase 1